MCVCVREKEGEREGGLITKPMSGFINKYFLISSYKFYLWVNTNALTKV